MPDAADQAGVVSLYLLATGAAVAALAAMEVVLDEIFRYVETGRDAFEDGDEFLAVGFPRREEA